MHIVQVCFVLATFVGLPALLFRVAFTMPVTLAELALPPVAALLFLAIRFFVRLRQVDRRVVFRA